MHGSAERRTNRRSTPGDIVPLGFSCLSFLASVFSLSSINSYAFSSLIIPQESPPLPPPLSRRPDTSRSLLSAPRLHESQPHSPAAHSPRAESLRSADPLAEPTSVGIGIRAINSSSSATLSQALGPHPLTAPSNPGLAPSIEQGRHLASSSLNFYHPFVQVRLSCIILITPPSRFAHLVTVHSSALRIKHTRTSSVGPISTFQSLLWPPFTVSL